MSRFNEGERPYTRDIHEARVARIQQILDFGLEFAHERHITEDQKLVGFLPDDRTIAVSDYPVSFEGKEYLRFFIIRWGDSDMKIQYKKDKRTGGITILDSTKWNKDGMTTVGHIQTAYTQEYGDQEFSIDIEGLMNSAVSWRLEPRLQPRR